MPEMIRVWDPAKQTYVEIPDYTHQPGNGPVFAHEGGSPAEVDDPRGGPDRGGPGRGLDFRAENDPNQMDYLNRVKHRLDAPDETTGRSIDMATSHIRDATEGRRRASKARMAGRGVLASSSAPELSDAAFNDQEGRDVNAAAAGISLQRARDDDQMLMGAQSAFDAPGARNLANRSLSIQAWQAGEANRIQQRQLATSNYLSQLDAVSRLLSM